MLELAPTESRFTVLNQDIEQLKAAAAAFEKKRAPISADARRASFRLAYLKLAERFRAPAKHYVLWRVGVLLIGPTIVGALSLVTLDVLTNSFSIGFWVSIVGAACAACAIAILLFCPSDERLLTALLQAEADWRVANVHLAQLKATDGLAAIEVQLRELLKERKERKRKLREEIREQKRTLREANLYRKWQRRSLLQRDWREMRGYDWENYLVEVFQALGTNATRIGGAGDQGVDLIVEFGTMRIAVQAKGYEDKVNNKAVQEVYAGMAHWRCTACAVITNSEFRASAFEIAGSTYCILIGAFEIPDLVMGKLDLARLAEAAISCRRSN